MPPAKLTKADKDIVNRAVPEPSNKVVYGAIARLYVNYPDRTRWNFTGISGVVVLAQDLVGKTLFLKIVDIKVLFCVLAAWDWADAWDRDGGLGKIGCAVGPGTLRRLSVQHRPLLLPLL